MNWGSIFAWFLFSIFVGVLGLGFYSLIPLGAYISICLIGGFIIRLLIEILNKLK